VTVITCKIPEALDAALEATARSRGVSKSRLVREAIEKSFEGKPAKGLSAYDLMKSACGVIRSGHKDLASNPKHMKGFGRD
jgi:hypothetical protein